MAYGLKIRFEHHDFKGLLSRIDILERDYSGASIERTLDGNEPMVITWGDKSNELPLVYGSEAVIKFFTEDDFEFLYLFTADSKKYQVKHYLGDAFTLNWIGFIAPENWKEPLTSKVYEVEATATDNLGALKDQPFVDDTGDFYEGEQTFIQIIANILMKTGLVLNINTAVNWKETAQNPAADPLAAHKLKVSIFEGMNCYEVLENILKTCRIFQRLGQWWIISNENFKNDTISYFQYDAVGTYQTTGTKSLLAADFWIENEPELDILPAVRKLTVIQDYGYNANLIINGSFVDYNKELNQFDTWTNVGGVLPEQRPLNADGDKYVFIPGREFPGSYASQGYGLMTHGIKKTIKVTATDSVMKFALKYAYMGEKKKVIGIPNASLMFIRITLVGDTQTYYLRRKPYFEKDPEFEWLNITLKPSTGDSHITLKSHLERTAISWYYPPEGDPINVQGWYYNTFDTVSPYLVNEITDHFEDFKSAVTGIPISGLLTIELLLPYSTAIQAYGSCYTGLNLELLDQESELYPTTATHIILNDENYREIPDDEELFIGDYPDIPNADIIYSGGIKRLDDENTTLWNVAGSTSYTFSEFIGRMLVAERKTPRQNYTIRLAEMLPGLNMIITDDTNPDRRFVENGVSYDNRMQAIEGQYTEVLTASITTFLSDTFYRFDDTAPGTILEPQATPVNIEERVTIITKSATIISAPSHLSDDDFETVKVPDDPTDDQDGFSRIQIKKQAVTPYNLSFDSGTPQFSIKEMGVICNVGGDPAETTIAAGSIYVHQFYALDKAEVLAVKEVGPYNPERVWTVDAASITFTDAAGTWLYLRLPTDEEAASGTFIISAEHLEPTIYDDYITYKIGWYTAEADNKRAFYPLWGNRVIPEQVQADWDQTDDTEPDYIKNKPTIGTDSFPATITSDTTNADDGETHTHELGTINLFKKENLEPVQTNYGYLYNGWVIEDGIAPIGYHVPTYQEWHDLMLLIDADGEDYDNTAADDLKENGTDHWAESNTGTNTTGLSLIGGGYRVGQDGSFNLLRSTGSFWCSDTSEGGQINIVVGVSSSLLSIQADTITAGLTIFLIKDDSNDAGFMTGNDGKIYPTKKIGDQVWVTKPLMETRLNNGSTIAFAGENGINFTDEEWVDMGSVQEISARCCYDNNEANAGISNIEIIQSGDAIVFHKPVTIHADSASHLEIDSNQVLKFIPANVIEDIAFEFCDVEAGTAKDYTLDIAASFGYTIEAACLETDNGTLTGVAIKIGSTAVTSLSSLTVDTGVDETASTGAKTVVSGDRVWLSTSTGYTGTPTLIRGKLKIQRT